VVDSIIKTSGEGQSQSKGEFLDAIRRHICQILGFDFGFIDVASGHEIKNVASFCFDDEADVAGEFVEALVDEHKQPITTPNTLIAQKVKQTQQSWVGKAYSQEDIEKGLEEDAEGFPYMIVPVIAGEVTGLIRVISFDPAREITSQDMMTLKLMGEHVASRTGLFGEFSSASPAVKQVGDTGDLDQVLLVHSNRLVRRRFNRILGSGYNVIESESSEKALEALESGRVDVILLDSDLQGASGFAFCKMLKESTKWKHIPVILVVQDNSTTARVEGLNVGADDCIPDSCFDTELLARLKSSLRHRKSERELAVQLQLLEDYAQRLEKAHEQLSIDRQDTIQRNSQLEQMKREGEVQRHQDNLLHRISNVIRKSFNIRENLEEMLEALSGWFSLDSTFIVMPNDEEPEDTVRVECVSDKAYKVVAYDRDLDIYEIFKKNFQADQSIISNDAANDRRLDPFHKILKSGFTVQSLFIIPITYEQKLQGLLVGYKCEARANWSRINETFMKSVVDQVAVGVVNARLYATVQRQATTDGLTGLFNHRTGQEKLADQLKQAERYQRRLSVIMLDVDHFKSINDTYGHPAGDSVLKAVARLIRNNCRDVDIPVRYGGEEFLLVLPEVTQDGATVVAERIRVALKGEMIKHEDLEIAITGSLGVACFPDDADSQQNLLDLADKSLYLSKRLGRDQVHTAADLMFEPEIVEEKSSEDIARDVRDGPFTPPVISEEARQHEELVPEVVDMVKSLAASLYAKSEYNKQHHLEVARMSELLAKVMGLSAQQVEQIRVAGLLHDVGVLQLPQELLHKEGRLTKEERDVVNQHATLGAQMLRPVRALKDICEILENHHERWDGTGYPKGLKGEDIPLPARIVAIVDSYHAMISERPYRPAMTHEEALKVLKDGAGKQWDPFLIEIFSAVMKSMRETTQEVQAKVALAATLARAGAEAEAAEKAAAEAAIDVKPLEQPSSPGEIGHEHHGHSHDHGGPHPHVLPHDGSHPAGNQPQNPTGETPKNEPVVAPPSQTAPAPAAATPVPQPSSKTADDGVIEELDRSEPSKISSIIGPVIKPISPARTDGQEEPKSSSPLFKMVEAATTTAREEEEESISATTGGHSRITGGYAQIPPREPAAQAPQQQQQPGQAPSELPQRTGGFAVPAPGTPAPSQSPSQAPMGGQLSSLVRPSSQNIPIPAQAAQQAPGQAPLQAPQPIPGQPGQMQPTQAPQQAPLQQPPQTQPVPQQTQPLQGQPPQQVPGQMPPQAMSGQQMQQPPQTVPPQGMPPQPMPGQQPQQPAPGAVPGMPPGPPGSSYGRLPAQSAPGMPPPGPGASGTSYNRLPAQQAPGMPPQGQPGQPQPAPQQIPAQSQQAQASSGGYPRPYAAGQPVGQQAPVSQQAPAIGAPMQAPVYQGAPGPQATMPAPTMQAPVLGAPQAIPAQPQPAPQALPPQQQPMQQQPVSPQPQPMLQPQPAPAPVQQMPQPQPVQAQPVQAQPQPVPAQPQPQPVQVQPQMQPVQSQPLPTQAPPAVQQAGAKPPEKQPDTWDPYSYDDEDEIEGGL